MRTHGYECVRVDATQLPFREESIRFVTTSHVLEHLPPLKAVEAAIRAGTSAGRGFPFVLGPYFDADAEFAVPNGLRSMRSFVMSYSSLCPTGARASRGGEAASRSIT